MTDPNREFAKSLFAQARSRATAPEPTEPERAPNAAPRAPDQKRFPVAPYRDPNASFIRGLFGRPE